MVIAVVRDDREDIIRQWQLFSAAATTGSGCPLIEKQIQWYR
jgi:hypothetical protein